MASKEDQVIEAQAEKMPPPDGAISGLKPTRLNETEICKVCGAVWPVYLMGDMRVRGMTCNCRQQEQEQQAAEDARRARQVAVKRLWDASGISRGEKTFANFNRRPGTELAYDLCREFVHEFDLWGERGKGLIFGGITGCGKTHLAKACLHALLANGVPCLFVKWPRYLDRLRREYQGNEGDIIALEDRVIGVDVLALDELGFENLKTEWVCERLYILLDSRIEKRLSTLITTNLGPEDMTERYGARVSSRIDQACYPAEITADDYRQRLAGKPQPPQEPGEPGG